ncbi:MAG: thiamine phosphate synthase [Deltaproteobacteria bacterium]|nr:MAG: thiamine phosphate synthase [Deltaproteobacteria bacterium]
MTKKFTRDSLKYYFITDHALPDHLPLDQVRIVLSAGATMVQYRNKTFSLEKYTEAAAIRDLCRKFKVPFLINDHILLAKALHADGVHLGQDDNSPRLARQILGSRAIIGLSVSTLQELGKSDLSNCDYIGSGPAFATDTKTDAKPVRGPSGLSEVAAASPLPVVAIGGITADRLKICLQAGAAGAAVISFITRAADPARNALAFGKACGCRPRKTTVEK